ncbi:MAG: M18 family aminopeptidase [Bacteroidetes bacterium 4572_117]|nr:MAG: M18 family aminopeptidase [Bacteroidetes bacterium 4572_117]
MLEQKNKLANDLIDYIDASPSPFHAVRNIKAALIKRGFKELLAENKWDLRRGSKYFISKNESSIIAFVTGMGNIEETGFRVVAAHTDSPSLKIKPAPEIYIKDKYLKLNTEVYGGAILHTWFDRPLSIAGRVSLKSNNPLKPISKYLNVKSPIAIIPSVAIHLNREINQGQKIENQKVLMPLLAMIDKHFEKDAFLQNLIAAELKIDAADILDFDLNLTNYGKGMLIGLNNEFISSGKLDDLAMVHAGIQALIDSKPTDATQVMVCFDNEEVGSLSKQGAGSPFLSNVLQRICQHFKNDFESFNRAIANSFLISADMAHAIHPNYQEKHDPINNPVINGGPVIKINANQKYTTDSDSSAVYEMLCRNANVPVQKYVNHSDIKGGSTLGSVSSGQLDFRSVDIGNPMLAMHSIRELGGVDDHYWVMKSFAEFYRY